MSPTRRTYEVDENRGEGGVAAEILFRSSVELEKPLGVILPPTLLHTPWWQWRRYLWGTGARAPLGFSDFPHYNLCIQAVSAF